MSKERDDKLDATRPTLIVRHGNTPRKYRRLEKEVMVLGRAPGCDLSLTAPEVALVHCVIVRAADGWRVRDCTGRGATRLNGRSVRDEVLHDEDILQVGSFSFALHLPPEPRRAAEPSAVPEADGRDEERLAERQDELDRQADELDALRSDLDARLGELRRTRQEVADETVALLKRHESVEMELKERQFRSDAALRASLEAYQARRREAEEAHARTLAEQERAHGEAVGEADRRLEIRAAELGRYAVHLRRRGHEAASADALRQENERLRRTLSERDAARTRSPFELEQLRREFRPVEGPPTTQDTVVDMPSPLHPGPKSAPQSDADAPKQLVS